MRTTDCRLHAETRTNSGMPDVSQQGRTGDDLDLAAAAGASSRCRLFTRVTTVSPGSMPLTAALHVPGPGLGTAISRHARPTSYGLPFSLLTALLHLTVASMHYWLRELHA
jgi:hypothetical protein